MAMDLLSLLQNIASFYDFSGKRVISVGAGGGQLVDFLRQAQKVWAVDREPAAIESLAKVLSQKGLLGLFEPVLCDFLTFKQEADLLVFEFSFHEMEDHRAALEHAQSLATEVLIMDHRPDSPWAWQVVEEEKVARSAAVYEQMGVRKLQEYIGLQRFADHDELQNKVKIQGELAIRRAEGYRGCGDFVVPMRYGLALL